MHQKWILSCILLVGIPAFGAIPFDCDRGVPLQRAIEFAFPGETLQLSGTCAGPLTISRNLTLIGKSKAVIEGAGKDAVTVKGPARVTLSGLTIQHGINGVTGENGAQLTISNSAVQENSAMGILLEGNSSATVSDSSTDKNGVNGLDAEASSSVILAGSFESKTNGVFGINVNASSSLTFTQAHVTVSHNILGIQIGTSASAFISDPVTVLTVDHNATTGLTIVSGAHMVAFGGTIQATGNGAHGISVDSKAGLDLDAAAMVTSAGNAEDGVHLEETSVLTMFNTPAFSGAQGFTTLKTENNGANGVSVLTGSNFTVIHEATLISTGNVTDGVLVDNGSALTLIQTSVVSGNGKDLALSFGSRGDITGTSFGSLTCDATVLLRGDTKRTCPR